MTRYLQKLTILISMNECFRPAMKRARSISTTSQQRRPLNPWDLVLAPKSSEVKRQRRTGLRSATVFSSPSESEKSIRNANLLGHRSHSSASAGHRTEAEQQSTRGPIGLGLIPSAFVSAPALLSSYSIVCYRATSIFRDHCWRHSRSSWFRLWCFGR